MSLFLGFMGISFFIFAMVGVSTMQSKIDEISKKILAISLQAESRIAKVENKFVKVFGDEITAAKQLEERQAEMKAQKAEIERLKRESDALKDREIERLRKELNVKK